MTGDALVLVLRVAFAALLYLFLFRLVTAIRRDLARAARASPDVAPAAARVAAGRLIVLEGSAAGLESGRSIPLSNEVLIGRALECQVRLTNSLVSAQHARLRRVDGRWVLEDLNSTNGTLLNQRPVSGEQPVEYGDVIGVGDVRMKLAP